MLTPNQYDALPDPLVAAAQRLEEDIIADICRRLAKESRVTSTALIQTYSLINYSGLRIDEILRRVASFTDTSVEDIYLLYQDAIDQIVEDERYVYEHLNTPTAFDQNEYRQGLLKAQARKTEEEFKNLTGSLGFLMNGAKWVPVRGAYQETLDYVIQQIQSGAFDPSTAIKRAVVRLTDSGLRCVEYASGHTDRVDVAVRRAVVTGMHQLSGQATEIQAEELGTSLFEVSAHSGARDTGSGFENHKRWQGKVYWYKTPVDGYKSLVDECGYGNVAGLEGANCRHSKHIYVEGISKRIYSDKDLRNIDKAAVQFEGKSYTAYEATQQQRKIERTMRFYKVRLLGLEEAGFGTEDKTYQQAASLLTRWSEKYKDFSRAVGLRTQPERAQVAGFSTGQAARARTAAKRA